VDNAFTVKVGEIEGPLDLILNLIEEKKMHVAEVSLASIADEFIAFVRAQVAFPAGQAAQFILVAATLLLLKSKALLPIFSLSEDEQGDIKDLERRLALLAVYRTVARRIGSYLGTPLFFGGLRRDTDPVFAPSRDMTADALYAAALAVLARAPEVEKLPETEVEKIVSLEEMMVRLSERIERALTLTFKDFVGTPDDKREVVIGFLAILELVKRGFLNAEQESHFTEIRMNYSGGTAQAPKYE
jgi:segregation and condensation protein A